MKPNELRIGNWVYDQIECRELQVSMPNKIAGIEYAEHFQPIPLTEEWLERFGFEKVNSKYVESDYYWRLRYDPSKGHAGTHFEMVTLWASEVTYGWVVVVNETESYAKYVHQLQNLYFALTWEELELKEIEP